MVHTTHNTPTETEARLINRTRELRRATRKAGYVMVLPTAYNDQNLTEMAVKLSAIIEGGAL